MPHAKTIGINVEIVISVTVAVAGWHSRERIAK
jgi:hypothetical protein